MQDSLKELASLVSSSTTIDLSPTIESGMPRWFTHPPVVVNPTVTHEHDGYYCQTLFLPEHVGSHVDAPAHIHAGMMDRTIDTVPLDALIGPGKLFDLRPLNLAPGDLVTAEDLEQIDKARNTPLTAGDVALFNYGWYERYWTTGPEWAWYAKNAPGFSRDACAWIAERRPRAVGADTVAFDTAMIDGVEQQQSFAHQEYFLPNDIYIIECLANLDRLPQHFFFMALPLKISAGSGSPIRAVALTYPATSNPDPQQVGA